MKISHRNHKQNALIIGPNYSMKTSTLKASLQMLIYLRLQMVEYFKCSSVMCAVRSKAVSRREI